MFKIAGGALVIISAFLFGCRIKKNMKDNCKFTEDLICGLGALKEEIRYTSDYLEKSILNCSVLSGTSKPFFDIIYNEMISGSTAENSINNALSVVQNSDIRNLLSELGKQVGKTDTDGQINMLESLIEKLKILYSKQSEFCEKQGNMYPKFGAVFGILITILLV